MKKSLLSGLFGVLLLLLMAVVFCLFRDVLRSGGRLDGKVLKRDTIVRCDTIVRYQPMASFVETIGSEKHRLRVWRGVSGGARDVERSEDMWVGVGDSLQVSMDSVDVEVPIERKRYDDSLYTAWVSGYGVSLDSIQIRQRTLTIRETVSSGRKRWSIGLFVGGGWNGRDIKPVLGIGLSYNILSW